MSEKDFTIKIGVEQVEYKLIDKLYLRVVQDVVGLLDLNSLEAIEKGDVTAIISKLLASKKLIPIVARFLTPVDEKENFKDYKKLEERIEDTMDITDLKEVVDHFLQKKYVGLEKLIPEGFLKPEEDQEVQKEG